MHIKSKGFWPLVKKTFQDWLDDEVPTLAAALSYYTVFSIAPLLLIAVAVAGLVFGEEAARGNIQNQLTGLVGSSSAQTVQSMMVNARKPSAGIVATVIGLLALAFGASGVFV